MVTSASSVDWTIVGTEVEALQLEYAWIKEYNPRFNVRYRDDKSYPYLAVTMAEEFPRVTVMRGAKRKGTRYFGPYTHAWAIRETVDLLLRVFPVRTCSAGVFRRAQQVARPCLLGYIDKCSAPCVGRVTAEQHRAIVEDFVSFMDGRSQGVTSRLTTGMKAAAAVQDSRAGRLRDDLAALARATQRNAVVLTDGTNADMLALVADELEAAVQVFHVRAGRIGGSADLSSSGSKTCPSGSWSRVCCSSSMAARVPRTCRGRCSSRICRVTATHSPPGCGSGAADQSTSRFPSAAVTSAS